MTFRLKATYMHIDVPREVMPYDEGDEPLRVKIRINLSFAEIDALTVKKETGLLAWSDLYAAYAPYVIEWNLNVPAPAEYGGFCRQKRVEGCCPPPVDPTSLCRST